MSTNADEPLHVTIERRWAGGPIKPVTETEARQTLAEYEARGSRPAPGSRLQELIDSVDSLKPKGEES